MRKFVQTLKMCIRDRELAVKFAECMLAVKYRRIRSDGTRWGGPMAVMEARLGRPGNPLGKLYARCV